MLSLLIASSVILKAQPQELPKLHAEGTKIVNASGQEVRLRGVNLGGWLVEEMWMTPWQDTPPVGSDLPKIVDHVTLWDVCAKRYGQDGAQRVKDAWRDNWITAGDFETIKKDGFDHVRLPFLSSILDEPNGLKRLHWAVDTAAAHGLYTVLDMHGAPGSQNDSDHSGQVKKNRLWFDVENITKMEECWTKLAREFGADPNVAMFDIMNEPMGAPNPSMLFLVYDRIYRAIRKVSSDKLLIIEDGYKGFDTTPHPNLAQWTNVVFSLHFYNFDAKKPEDHVAALQRDEKKDKELQGYRQAPLYIGEFNLEPNSTATVTKQFTDEMTANGWSWTIWTYKTDAKGGPMGQWGVYRRDGKPTPLDPFKDSLDEILGKMKSVRTENFARSSGFDAIVKG